MKKLIFWNYLAQGSGRASLMLILSLTSSLHAQLASQVAQTHLLSTNSIENGLELINAARSASNQKIRELLKQGANPNTLSDGTTPFLVADEKEHVEQVITLNQVGILEALIANALADVENKPNLQEIRSAIAQALLDYSHLKSVASRLVQVFPDPTAAKCIRVRCDAVAYDDVAGYHVCLASGMNFRSPPEVATWIVVPSAATTDIRLRQDHKGKWKGVIEQGVSFAQLRDLRALKITPDAYKTQISRGSSALAIAFLAGDDSTAYKLVDAAPKQQAINGLPTDPIIIAAFRGCSKTTGKLLERGTDVNVVSVNFDDTTALCMAAQNGHADIARLLLEKGADPNKAKTSGITALMCASDHGYNDVVELLVKKGAKVNAISEGGGSALSYAIHSGWTKTVSILCSAGADVNRKFRDGTTMLKFAEKSEVTDIVVILRAAGAK